MPFKNHTDWSKISESSLKSITTLNSGRFINSVSDLYGIDEIDALLEEIKDFEQQPKLNNLKKKNLYTNNIENNKKIILIEDYEIDGSIMTACDSRTSVHSWDSHGIYKDLKMDDLRTRIGGPISIYCDLNHIKTPIGILRILLTITSMICMICLLTAGTINYGIFMLPFVARIRLMLFVILFTTMVTILLIFLDISLLYRAFPFHYHRWAIAIYTMECAAFMCSSALIVTLVQIYTESFPWVESITRNMLIVSSVFGFISGTLSLILAIYGFYDMCRFHSNQLDNDELTLTERATYISNGNSNNKKIQTTIGILNEPIITGTVWPIDDCQPCSSKHLQ